MVLGIDKLRWDYISVPLGAMNNPKQAKTPSKTVNSDKVSKLK
jgi:hypothetical protein